MSSGPLNIEKIFDTSRFPPGPTVIPIILYFPVGLILSVFRVFIGFHAFVVASVLPKSLPLRSSILRALCSIIGIVAMVEDERSRTEPRASLIVSNHVSILDHLAIDLVQPHLAPSVWDIPAGLAWLLGYRDLGVRSGTDVLVENIGQHFQKSSLPILIFPEGGTTNGAAGLLKFSVWPFALKTRIQPVALKVERPSLLPIAISPLGSRWWSDIFWFLFSPYTVFKIKFLPSVEIGENEEAVDLAKRTERCIADSLFIRTTNHTDQDKVDFVKRSLFDKRKVPASPQQATALSRTSSASARSEVPLDEMAGTIQKTFPQFSAHVIHSDLAKTRDMNETISNLVGQINTSQDNDTPSQTDHGDTRVFSAPEFSRKASTREMSFKERKQQMIEWARERYKQKHGL